MYLVGGEARVFATIGRTWGLAKMSWSVLQKDRELMFFPVLTLVGAAIVAGIFAAIAAGTGSLEHLKESEGERTVSLVDVIVLVLFLVSLSYVVVFFNAALIAAAMERLRGGDPNVASGLRAVLPHAHNILGWAIISASVGLLLNILRSRTDSFLGRLAISMVGGVWGYMTFFVVPMLVVQGLSPFGAIKSSAGLFKRTWGEQVTAGFGFGLFYLAAGAVAVLPALVVFAINPVAGIIVGALLLVVAMAAVMATEGIFKAALYEYAAEGVTPKGFENSDLRNSYERNQFGSNRGPGF